MDVSERKQCLSITHLPNDLLRLIYGKLYKKCDQESFGLTCHRFLDIKFLSCTQLDLGCLTKSDSSYLHNSVKLDELLNCYRLLESPSLLSVINLSYCSITDNGLETLTKSCKALKNVNLTRCSHITDSGIWFLNQNCRHLQALKISGCDKVIGIGFQHGFSETLVYLQADSHVLNPTGITGFLGGGGLEYLNIAYSNKYYTDVHGLAAFGSGIAKNLKILNFWMCTNVSNDCIIKISKGCPLLQEWNLSCCKIRLSGWESIGLHCQNLKRLHVNSCRNLCDRGLLALANGCKLLSVLYMTDCPLITPSGKQSFKIQRADVKIEEKVGMTNFPSCTCTWPKKRRWSR